MTNDESTWNGKIFFMNYHGSSYTDPFTFDSSEDVEDSSMEEKIIIVISSDLGSSGLPPTKGIG